MKNVLITGGNGFLGKNLQSHLYGANIYSPNSRELNIMNVDILWAYLQDNQIDTILHMAAVCGGILANKNSPADFLFKNTQMGLNIYEAARQSNVSKIYSLGSVCSYPVNCSTPFKEEDIWNGPPESTNKNYGQAKRTLMMLSQSYREQYGIGGAHLIPVNMFGPHDCFDLVNSHVIPALIRKFVTATEQNLPTVECWGTGTGATREFLYGPDCAEVLAHIVRSGFDHDGPINLGVGKDISILDLANLIGRLTGFAGKIVFTGEVSDGQPKRLLDVSKAKQLLDWTAKTDLETGLIQTIEWYKENRPTI